MTKAQANQEYFYWMLGKVCAGQEYKEDDYHELLLYLYGEEFEWEHPMDSNRATDGEDLRYRFGRENGYSDAMISALLDDRPCSILEMMAALAIRCEFQYASNPEIGDRTGVWFWQMIDSLGLTRMQDPYFDLEEVQDILDTFQDRRYEPNGRGGLFTLRHPKVDMRTVDIWYQMCYYLNENL